MFKSTLAEHSARHNLKLRDGPIKVMDHRERLVQPRLEVVMTTFDQREKAFEDKFAHDADLKFKAEARRNKLLATWAAVELGYGGAAADFYVKAVSKAALSERGDDDVFDKIRADFQAHSVAVSDETLRAKMTEFLAKAVESIETGD